MDEQTLSLNTALGAIDMSVDLSEVFSQVTTCMNTAGYTIKLSDFNRPWGGFVQLVNEDADRFVSEFFPGLTPEEARLGNVESELSPKILIVAPNQRLSWQYHDRRAERWAYITEGGYFKSMTDEQGELQLARPREVVQFAKGERHRLVGSSAHVTLVAEIWQHADAQNLSDEQDIVRLEDDYKRG